MCVVSQLHHFLRGAASASASLSSQSARLRATGSAKGPAVYSALCSEESSLKES